MRNVGNHSSQIHPLAYQTMLHELRVVGYQQWRGASLARQPTVLSYNSHNAWYMPVYPRLLLGGVCLHARCLPLWPGRQTLQQTCEVSCTIYAHMHYKVM